MNEEKWKLEDHVDDWVKKFFERLKQNKYTVKSAMSDFLKSAIQEGVKLKRLKLEEEGEKEKGKSWIPDFELECFKIPVLIEDKLGVLKLSNKSGQKLKHDIKSVKNYAVNGAIHYAQCAILSKKYSEVIAIGIAGDNAENVKIEVYYVYGSTDETYKLISSYKTLDFLENEESFNEFYKSAVLTEEEKHRILIDSREKLQKYAKDLNKLMHNHSITAPQRVLYVSGMLLAMQDLVRNERIVKRGLIPDDLEGIDLDNQRDGDIIVNHIKNYLDLKDIQDGKVGLMMASFHEINKDTDRDVPIELDRQVSKLIKDRASVNKQVFTYIYENIFTSIDSMSGHLDIMGEMYSEFLKFALGDGKEIGIVLTPPYVTKMMAEILEVDMDSKVMDLATGSAGFLISSMEIMIDKAESKYGKNTSRANRKIENIKKNQLLGVELNAEMFTLASTNMILKGDGSSNIRKGSSFDEPPKIYQEFNANKLLINPPFSYHENGMPFIEFGLRNMKKGGKAAIIIQDSAGNGQGIDSCRKILNCNQLLASIKMPTDLFIPMAGVQTSIYVFEHTEKQHNVKKQVKFIDFRNDGYKRTKRGINEIDSPNQRYQDIIEIYENGVTANVDSELWNLEEQVIMDVITLEGNDWNFEKHQKIDMIPTEADFRETVRNYLDWKVKQLFQNGSHRKNIEKVENEHCKENQNNDKDCILNQEEQEAIDYYKSDLITYKKFKIGDLFDIHPTSAYQYTNRYLFDKRGKTPIVTNSSLNNGITGYSNLEPTEEGNIITYTDTTTSEGIFYQPDKFIGYSHVQGLYPYRRNVWNEETLLYFVTLFKKCACGKFDYGTKFNRKIAAEMIVKIPINRKGKIDFDFMKNYINAQKKLVVKDEIDWRDEIIRCMKQVILED